MSVKITVHITRVMCEVTSPTVMLDFEMKGTPRMSFLCKNLISQLLHKQNIYVLLSIFISISTINHASHNRIRANSGNVIRQLESFVQFLAAKAALGFTMSVCPSVCLSVRLSVRQLHFLTYMSPHLTLLAPQLEIFSKFGK